MTDINLMLLKKDLQMLTDANDEYLSTLLQYAEKAIIREGIQYDENNIEHRMVKIQYAAYLFRKRAAQNQETNMPRYLRFELNNLIVSQKGKTNDL